jgi:hypothetical protein
MDSQAGKLYKRVGHCHCLLVSAQGKAWICIGPDWRYFLGLFIILGGVGGLFVFKVAAEVGSNFQIVGILLYTVTMGSFGLTGLLDPGINHPYGHFEPLVSEAYCSKCQSPRIPSSEHCDICGVCIRQRDHHCPWMNKCIGENNVLPFYLFIAGVVMMLFYMLMCSALVQKPQNTK